MRYLVLGCELSQRKDKLVTYCVAFHTASGLAQLEITQDEYQEILKAKSALIDLVEFEEKLIVLLRNYQELEIELLRLALERTVIEKGQWSEVMDDRLVVNLRIANFLTACKLYTDHMPHLIIKLFGRNSTEIGAFNALYTNERDAVIGFKIMESIRDLVQHRAMPISSAHWGMHWVNIKDQDVREHTYDVYLNVQAVAKDRKLDAKVKASLDLNNRRLSVKPLIRQHADSFVRIHLGLRKIFAGKALFCDGIVENILSNCSAVAGKPIKEAIIVQKDRETERIIQKTNILGWTDRRKMLARKVSYPRNLYQGIVTSR